MQLPKLNEAEKKQLRIQIESEIYRRSLYEFYVAASKILYPNVDWQYPPFIKYLCDLFQSEVERIIRKEEKQHDIILNMPFRSGKSILLSQILPVWCFIKKSGSIVMQISHSELLAVKHSHASKMLIESEWFQTRFPEIKIRQDTSAKANYMLEDGSKRISFGCTSGIIGEGFNMLQIVDDINSPNDSQTVTQGINDIYANTLYSRISDFNATRIILQQRVASNDICGYLLETNPDKYLHVCLPVRVSPNISPIECIDLYHNGLLWEDRFNDKVIQDFQQTLGSRNFSQQMMQTAVSAEGNIFKLKWLQKISLKDFLEMTDGKYTVDAFIDTAYTSKAKDRDASAIILSTSFNNNVYILKAWKVWKEFPELVQMLKDIQKDYAVRMLYIEAKASGLSIKQQLQREGFDCADLTPKDKDKVARANAVAPKVEGGHLWLVEDNWNSMVETDLAGFPLNGRDITDVVVYSIDTLLNKSNFNYAL